jgi:hypothetical protein
MDSSQGMFQHVFDCSRQHFITDWQIFKRMCGPSQSYYKSIMHSRSQASSIKTSVESTVARIHSRNRLMWLDSTFSTERGRTEE